jgi:hypothetical protein
MHQQSLPPSLTNLFDAHAHTMQISFGGYQDPYTQKGGAPPQQQQQQAPQYQMGQSAAQAYGGYGNPQQPMQQQQYGQPPPAGASYGAQQQQAPPPNYGGQQAFGASSMDVKQGSLQNNYARPGGQQNVGNFITDKPSSRVLAPPGGKSQISFG